MLIFVPGLICDARIYAPQTAAFHESLAVDGFGLANSLPAMARIVLEAADRGGAAQFDLFGHSMGGRIALEVFRLAPQRVRRLALVSTGVHPLAEGEAAKRTALMAIGHEQGFPVLVDRWLTPMVAPANRAKPEIWQPMLEMCLAQGQAKFDCQIRALVSRPAVDELLPEIHCPTLVMTGELDGWAPPEQHEDIAARMPNASLSVVPGAGHMIQAEAPLAVNEAIAGWLARPA